MLLTGRIGPSLLRFAGPFMIASFLQTLYGAVDLLVVGQFSGSASVSAVATGSQVMMIITSVLMGLSTGGTVLIGRRIGEDAPKKAASAVGTLTVLFLLMALAFTPVMLVFTDAAVALMATPIEAVDAAEIYIRICSAGIPFIIGYNGVSAVFRGTGDSRTPVLFIGIACAANILGDLLLVGAMHLGAAGAAAATIAAQGISFLFSLIYIARRGLVFPFSARDIRLNGSDAAFIMKVGMPIALQDTLVHFSFLAITAIINTLGVVASAAVGIAEKVLGFAFLPAGAFSSAVATMAAQNIGAGYHRRAESSWKYAMLFSGVFGVLVCLAVQIVPGLLPSIFSKDAAVIKATGEYMRTYSIDCILVSFVFCTNAYFSAYGRSIISFAHSMVATFAVRIPVTFLFSRVVTDSLLPMGWAAPMASLVSIVICLAYLPKMRRETIISANE